MLVRIEHSGGVSALTLARPEARNALSIELCDAIVEALDEIASDNEARVVVVRGEGKSFCAGAALGGGFQLATVCDFRISTDDAVIGIPSSTLGIVVNLENVQRLVALCGAAVAKEILMAARRFTGAEALAAHLVTRSVPVDQFDGVVDDFARSIAALAPISVGGAKQAIQLVVDRMTNTRAGDPDSAAAFDEVVAAAYRSSDLAEGLRAAAAQQSPRFTGS
ncbi:MAG: enoyl-CoA hydratase/isomerase family protein [Actinomycetota bacterium]|nr:enoyl-CoA hydratase/isomerase family protein [Actinomycetota bacterium]